MLTGTLPLPDNCTLQGQHDWNPITAASSQSALAAVLAGFVFAGLIVVLSGRDSSRSQDTARALKLMFTAFLGLTTTAYLLATLAGEQTCPRAETEEVLGGGVLGTSAIVMFVSLTWLILAYSVHSDGVLRFLRRTVYAAELFVVLLVCSSSAGYVNSEMPGVNNALNDYLSDGASAIAAAASALWLWRSPPGPKADNQGSPPPADATKQWDELVNWCIWTAVAYIATSSIVAGLVESMPAKDWYPHPPAWIIYASAWIALVFPLIALVAALRALAQEPTQKENPGGG